VGPLAVAKSAAGDRGGGDRGRDFGDRRYGLDLPIDIAVRGRSSGRLGRREVIGQVVWLWGRWRRSDGRGVGKGFAGVVRGRAAPGRVVRIVGGGVRDVCRGRTVRRMPEGCDIGRIVREHVCRGDERDGHRDLLHIDAAAASGGIGAPHALRHGASNGHSDGDVQRYRVYLRKVSNMRLQGPRRKLVVFCRARGERG